MSGWSKKTLTWTEGDTAFVSVPFTWNLPKAFSQCVWLKQQGYYVRAGGPAVSLLPDYLKDVSQIGGEVPALQLHNPEAIRTTVGCPDNCSFCAVRIIEPVFKELPVWFPNRLVMDNNLFASSTKHFDRVIDSLKPIKYVDFNQGLQARRLTEHHIERLQEIYKPTIRLAWDKINEESHVRRAVDMLVSHGLPHSRITVYVLIGFNDTPDDALYRLVTLRDVLKVTTFPMRFQPLYALKYNSYVAPAWTNRELSRMVRYFSRQRFLRQIPYAEYGEYPKGTRNKIPQAHAQDGSNRA